MVYNFNNINKNISLKSNSSFFVSSAFCYLSNYHFTNFRKTKSEHESALTAIKPILPERTHPVHR